MKWNTKLAAGAAAGAMFLSQVGVVAAADSYSIMKTGNRSRNVVEVMKKYASSIYQTNETHVDNNISVEINTGENESNHNTGDGEANSGAATMTVFVSNSGNVNVASTDDCGCVEDDADVVVEETGNRSYNRVSIHNMTLKERIQQNRERIDNDIRAKIKTGENEANGNTGNGSTTSEDADVVIEVVNEGGSNLLE